MYSAIVSVLPSGPPWSVKLMFTTWSKSCSVAIVEITSEKTITGFRSGNVTYQKRCQALAPSISAASCTSRGTPCRPARKITTWKPSCCQTITTDGHERLRGAGEERLRVDG